MDRSLIKTKICVTCEHEAGVCTCEKPKVKLFVDYIEKKYHAKDHIKHPDQCYQAVK